LLALSLEAGFLQAAHLADFGNGRVRFGLYSELYSAGNKFQLQAGAYVQPCPAHPEATQFYAGDGDVIVFAIAAGVVQGLDADAGGLAHVKLAPGEFGRRGVRPGTVHGGPPIGSPSPDGEGVGRLRTAVTFGATYFHEGVVFRHPPDA
jgi:hypothetical protein